MLKQVCSSSTVLETHIRQHYDIARVLAISPIEIHFHLGVSIVNRY
jgi:hypothetical protein